MNLTLVSELLIQSLEKRNLNPVSIEGKIIRLEKGYVIEIENPQLFKLIHQGHVIAPFADTDELIEFIEMDKKLNGEN